MQARQFHRIKVTCGAGFVSTLFLVVAGCSDSGAEAVTDEEVELIAERINATAPPIEAKRIPVNRTAKAIEATSDTVDIAIPQQGNGRVRLRKKGQAAAPGVDVGLPSVQGERAAAIAKDGTVVFAGGNRGAHVAIQAYDSGLRIQTVVNDASAAVEFEYPLEVPAGARIELVEEGGVLVVDAEGSLYGGFAPPWAVDSDQVPVPTHFEVRGTTVVQVVDHRQPDVKYPVVADPWLGVDLISSASWSYDSGHGWTLKVSPTGWARAFAGSYAVGVAGWNELYSKYKNRGLNTNLGGMKDQYVCHQQVVAVRSPTKSTWNLDEWRPDVSYAATVNARCNPGGPSIFD